MKKKLFTLLALGVMMVMAMTGCGKNTDDKKTQDSVILEKENDNTQADGEEPKVDAGNVVASSVAIVEILDVLGVPMVGVPTSSYTLPDSVANATRIGNPMSPDMEVIASLAPDVIVSVDSLSEELAEQFKILGADVKFANLSGYEGLKKTITELGTYFGVEAKAQELISGFSAKEAGIEAKIAGKDAPTVLIIFGAGTSFMTASEDTYVGDLVKRVGGVNIITDSPSAFAPVDMEYLVAQNPDYILFMSHANPQESLKAFKQEVEGNPAWNNFDAVNEDRLIALETGYFGMSANLLAADAMEKLVDILYGEQ